MWPKAESTIASYKSRANNLIVLIGVNLITEIRGAVASWLVRSSPDRAVRVRALALGKTLDSHSASLHPGV